MDLLEYKNVEHLTYLEYCDYLQNKYGIGVCDYMTPNWSRKNRISRTQEGLLAHHKYEIQAPNLSNPNCARRYPFEWQLRKNIVYCNYLEHLLLHILICEAFVKHSTTDVVGIRGIISYLIPELDNFYNGFESETLWKKVCLEAIKNYKSTYLALLERFERCTNSF